jgi:type II secretory pathway pseudopilin PulG
MSKATRLLAAVAVLAALAVTGLSTASAQQPTRSEIERIRYLYLQTNAAVHDSIVSQTEFNLARAANDEVGMHDAAADMLGSLAAATYWSARLDERVTATSHTEEIDEQVANLASRIATAYDNVEMDFQGGDLDAISQRLDQSSGTFTSVIQDVRSLNDVLFPRQG